ncbi:hypothetical protein [Mucilaginibacter aquatilis]|uniref:DUF4157 domain-containing protein n=1 Tax=Mucilaginibacter aquatilis TaxID=1517760 RepID=A0A6I4I680_9SPHI|nr:hypothetical protein [Mucilaginibacter aquatilis]MVN90572.1 hypothetical protein [Mucilaginibacter aquatilis]
MKFPVIVVSSLKVDGMAVFPFILVRTQVLKNDVVLLRHETIHLKQAAELLVIPFYLLYLLNYLVNRLKYNNHQTAYEQIVFEREAYRFERDDQYLSRRKLWAWVSCFS